MTVSVMIFTLNEEIHLPSCLQSLAWCDDIIVVDSFSTDQTEAICEQNKVRFFQHEFTGFGDQRNWALDHCEPHNDWILILDADEKVPVELADELLSLAQNTPENIGAYRLRRRFYMWGRWLKHSSLYPTWVVRFIHKDRVRYENRGHAETQIVTGETAECQYDLIDENLKGIDEWFERQNRYSRKDVMAHFDQNISFSSALASLMSFDSLTIRFALKSMAQKLPARGFFYFIYAYIFRLGFLDGYAGFIFCQMRSSYQLMLEAKAYDQKIKQNED